MWEKKNVNNNNNKSILSSPVSLILYFYRLSSMFAVPQYGISTFHSVFIEIHP